MMAFTFTVTPKEPELIVPAQPTPHEIKAVSDLDDQESLRCHYPMIMFYKSKPSMEGLNPVKIIREALAETLVYYYPYAGRLIEWPDNKFMVDCTAEGVVFVEADASVGIDQLGDTVQPPCPYPELLVSDVPGSDGMIGCPLMLVQVTRFKCGGFVLAIRFNHVISDALGSLQFVTTMSEMAKGAPTPSILPVWKRELLTARNPPHVTHAHPEYEVEGKSIIPSSLNDKNLRVCGDHTQGPYNLTLMMMCESCAWLMGGKNCLDLPSGYYGNAIICPAKVSKAKILCESPLSYAIKLVKEARRQATPDYSRSTIDFIATKERPKLTSPWNFLVSDTSKVGFDEVDFGWGNPIYGGTMYGGTLHYMVYARYRNQKGEDVMVVPMTLPGAVMERFEDELRILLCDLMKNSSSLSPIMVPSKL
ncbi:UNVERIFIED_CONTAM: Methanol O-anthraniloyltransferase [Sesamum radiatum]|uniref:Methanol O-anthraniloyltransferase n=1 Tax=Sesamum radiatum TaxID=300843 RepID=A0AAW2MHS6_SESRA